MPFPIYPSRFTTHGNRRLYTTCTPLQYPSHPLSSSFSSCRSRCRKYRLRRLSCLSEGVWRFLSLQYYHRLLSVPHIRHSICPLFSVITGTISESDFPYLSRLFRKVRALPSCVCKGLKLLPFLLFSPLVMHSEGRFRWSSVLNISPLRS